MRSLPIVLALALLLPRLPLCQTATLGKAPFNGLQARVAAIRFFESGGVLPDPKQRVFSTTFDALTTRFIFFELELAYAAARKRTAFQVECVFAGPDGRQLERTLSGTIEPGWTGSYHAAGVGSPERGQWAEGVYMVGCREAGQPIVSTRVEVVKSAAAVGKLGAAVVQLKFFQSLAERAPLETRRYSTRFDNRTARWIKTEFALVYPQVTAATNFSVECAYVFPDKSVKRVTVERQIPVGWTGSVHSQGVAAESWPVGRYSVSCWNNGERMAERSFEVFDSGTGNREAAAGGRLRFFAGKLGSAADPAYGTAFPLGSYDTLFVEARVPARVIADSAAFGCLLTDPAGISSTFPLAGGVRERELVARGPLGSGDPPWLRGFYRVECRTGARAVLAERFEVTGQPDRPELDARLVTLSLFAGEAEPGDEAVPDAVWSAARLKSLWLVALLDHPTDAGVGWLGYSCRVTGPRNLVVADTGPEQLRIGSGERVLLLRQRLALLPKQRWVAGKYTLSCSGTGGPLLKTGFDLTR
ncbi:MAG TPA: hypothetical protein VGQ69_12655 [Gemmatimonadales bacterium]|jgi:hypothetical protein|nr:hypothetical protein [Gemmatimonadales bacterium]